MEKNQKQDQQIPAEPQTAVRRDDDDRVGTPAPRLPHERDESHDSQTDKPRDVIRQAHTDIEDGLVDTDRRGTPGVEKVKQGGEPAGPGKAKKSR